MFVDLLCFCCMCRYPCSSELAGAELLEINRPTRKSVISIAEGACQAAFVCVVITVTFCRRTGKPVLALPLHGEAGDEEPHGDPQQAQVQSVHQL